MSFFNPFRRNQQPSHANGSRNGPASARGEDGAGEEEEDTPIRLVVRFERDRFNIPIKRPGSTPLSTLIETLSQHTSVPASQLKLISNGAVLKNPSLPLSSFGLRDGSTIVFVGANSAPPSAPPAASAGTAGKAKAKEVVPDTENGLVEFIKGRTDFVDELKGERERYMADVEAYCGGPAGGSGAGAGAGEASKQVPALAPPLASNTADAPSKPTSSTLPSSTASHPTSSPVPVPSTTPAPSYTTLERSHARLSEILLQGLLKLDGTAVPPEWTRARAARKEGVREVQKRLDEVDEAWARCKRRRTEKGE